MRNAKAHEAPNMELTDLGKPGAYRFIYEDEDDEKPIGMYHGCPCGCGILGTIFFADSGYTPAWTVEGEWPNVTLSPSILINKNHWHGYLRNGVFEEV